MDHRGELRWYDRLSAMPPEARFVARCHLGPVWSPALLDAQERHPATTIERVRYAAWWRDGRALAWAPVARLSMHHPVLTDDQPLRALSLGDGMGYCTTPVAVDDAVSDRADVLVELLAALDRAARDEALDGLLLLVLPDEASPLRDALDACGYVRQAAPSWSYVPLRVDRWGPFPGGLRGNYRSVIRRKRRAVDDVGVTLSHRRDGVRADRLYALYERLAREKDATWRDRSPLALRHPPGFFARVVEDPAFRVCAARAPDGDIVAYNVSVRTGDIAQSLVVGLDDDVAARLGGPSLAPALYQSLHAEVIARAEADGCRWMNLGTDAEEGKARLGALLRPMAEASRALTPAFQRAQERVYPLLTVPAPPACHAYAPDAVREAMRAAGAMTLLTAEATS